jgi:tRNA-splicing ligase RtcB (3'-phosphate/5'-hydroxy nucleic acid ligase)
VEQIGKKLFSWASILEPSAREQASRTASMPFVYPHLALMPDAHEGKGATVGSVIPTLGAIVPAAVGVDLGCGMQAVRTQFTAEDIRRRGSLSPLREAIEAVIPLSAGVYNTELAQDGTKERVAVLEALDGAGNAESVAPNWRLQLGTLGSGNHFIEVSLDELDRVWLFLHSGSRGVGNKLATRHIKVAQRLCERWWIPLPDPDLAYLVEGTDEFWAYIRDLRWAQHFALLNRDEMMDRIIGCLAAFLD